MRPYLSPFIRTSATNLSSRGHLVARYVALFALLVIALGGPIWARTIGPITFEDRTITPAGAPAHGLTITTVNGQIIPAITFKFQIDGNPSQYAAIRRGPDGNAVVDGWGIEGPTEGELSIDFGQGILGFSAGMGLLSKQGETSAVLVETFGPEGELLEQRIFSSIGSSDGSFSSVQIALTSDLGLVRSAKISWLTIARRFFFDNLVLHNLPVAPEPPPNGRVLSLGGAHPIMTRLSPEQLAAGWLSNGSLQLAVLNTADELIEGPRFASVGNHTDTAPAILALQNGSFAVAWYSSAAPSGQLQDGFYLRIFSNQLRTFEPPQLVVPLHLIDANDAVTSLSETSHGINLSWSDGRTAGVSHYSNGSSTPLRLEPTSPMDIDCGLQSAAINAKTVAIWCESISPPAGSPDQPSIRLMAQALSATGAPTAAPFEVSSRLLGSASDLLIKTFPGPPEQPEIAVVSWRQVRPGGRPVIFSRVIDQAEVKSPVLRVQSTTNARTSAPVLNVTENGFLVTWQHTVESFAQTTRLLKARTFHRSGAPASAEFDLFADDRLDFGVVAVEWNDQEIQLAWENTADAATAAGVFLSRFPVAPNTNPCTTSGTTLCLGPTQRFRATVQWQDFEDNRGDGQARQLTSDTGYFWFFQDGAADLVVKVIDGTASNSHHWLFFGSLTNTEFDLIVEDLLTGTTKRYHNPSKRFASVGDTAAFMEQALPSQDSVGDQPSNPQTATDPGWNVSELAEGVPGFTAVSQPFHSNISGATPGMEATGSCDSIAATQPGSICIGDRFLLSSRWQDFNGGSGLGHGNIVAENTGSFWFFDQRNLELMIKIVDGRDLNGHFWVFYGALTNVGFSLSVTDTQTGQETTYVNPSGTFASVGDLTSLSG